MSNFSIHQTFFHREFVSILVPHFFSLNLSQKFFLERETCNQFIENQFKKHYEKKLVNKKPSDFIIKVSCLAEFFEGDKLLCETPYIKSQLAKKVSPIPNKFPTKTKEKIELALFERQEATDDDTFTEDFPEEVKKIRRNFSPSRSMIQS